MKAQNLIGLTIAEALEKIKKAESQNDFYQFYICTLEHKQKDFKKTYKRWHLYNENGERVYKVVEYDLLTYAKDKELQNKSFVLDAKILKEYHDNWSFNGYENTASHNLYYLYIDGITKGNKGREEILNRKEHLIAYKKGELTKAQRRIVL